MFRIRRVCLIALLAGFGCRGEERPVNLLLVTLDTLRADHLGAYGGKVATPNLDALAARGVLFEQASTPAPLTTPAHASLFTGLYPWRHGLRTHGLTALGSAYPLLAGELGEAGLATAAFVSAYPLIRLFGLDRGFATYDDQFGVAPGGDALLQRSADAVTDRTMAWLKGHAASPFFLWVHYYDAHAPYAPPEPWRSRYPQDGYSGEVAFVDAQVGRLFEALRESGQEARTLVVVVADHGEGLGDHGEQEHGLLLYEEALRVPLLMAGPGVPAGRRIGAEVSLVDLRATLLARFGLPSGATDGIDLAPLLRRRSIRERALFAETVFPPIEFGWSPMRSVLRNRLKAIEAPRPELYDLTSDPHERSNLFDRRGAEARSLLELLAALPRDSASAPPAPSQEAAAALESLGYVAGGPGASPAAASLPDPKDRVADHEAFVRACHLGFEDGPAGAEEALLVLKDLVARDGRNPQFRLKLASLLDRTGRTAEAEAALRALVADHPSWSVAVRRLAELLMANDRPREAIPLLESFVARYPDLVGMEENVALARRLAGDAKGALEAARSLVRARPRDVSAQVLLAKLAAENGLSPEARRGFEFALGADPDNIEAMLYLPRILLEQGETGQSLALLERGMAAHPRRADLAAVACQVSIWARAAETDRYCGWAKELGAGTAPTN